MTVTANSNYVSGVLVGAPGNMGDYTLTGTVTVSFIGVSDGNAVIGAAGRCAKCVRCGRGLQLCARKRARGRVRMLLDEWRVRLAEISPGPQCGDCG